MNWQPLVTWVSMQSPVVRTMIYEFLDKAEQCGWEVPNAKTMQKRVEAKLQSTES